MVEGRLLPQQERVDQLRQLTKTDPDPRVRRRAHGVLLVEQGQTLAQVARFFGTAPHRVRAWQERFLTAGRAGLADQARGGRPPKLNEAARALLSEALDREPRVYGFPVTVWTLDDLQTLLLRERGVHVSRATAMVASVREAYRARILDIMWAITFAAYEVISGQQALPTLITIVPSQSLLTAFQEVDVRQFLLSLAERIGRMELANRDTKQLLTTLAGATQEGDGCPCCGRAIE